MYMADDDNGGIDIAIVIGAKSDWRVRGFPIYQARP